MSQSTIPNTQKSTEATPIPVTPCATSRIGQVDLDNPGFGDRFADHMASMEYRDGEWQQPEIVPYGELSLSPATATLHYGQTVFEGMKAFRGADGTIRIFRLNDHLERLNNSCRRMCIPQLNTELLAELMTRLIELDSQWVPQKHGNALYIRPLIFATDPKLGVKPSETYRLVIITSPVGAYFEEGFDPVSLTTTDEYIRAVEGGSGMAKTACNYGPTLLPAEKAKQDGYAQIIWLDAHEHRYIEEVGTMNIFFKIGGELHTPLLSGSILGGITRDSALQLANSWGLKTHERAITIDEVFDAHRAGDLKEVFGTGTAAVVSPVGSIHHNGETIVTDEQQIGPFAQKLYDAITGIQYGKQEDPFNWMFPV